MIWVRRLSVVAKLDCAASRGRGGVQTARRVAVAKPAGQPKNHGENNRPDRCIGRLRSLANTFNNRVVNDATLRNGEHIDANSVAQSSRVRLHRFAS
jgi:hypothetical protein